MAMGFAQAFGHGYDRTSTLPVGLASGMEVSIYYMKISR